MSVLLLEHSLPTIGPGTNVKTFHFLLLEQPLLELYCKKEEMDGRTDGWMDGRMDGWMDGQIDRQRSELKDN